ncbi:MAG: bifunctional phosphoglucose/phosphomannose isomerase [Nanobdellota archaeon]
MTSSFPQDLLEYDSDNLLSKYSSLHHDIKEAYNIIEQFSLPTDSSQIDSIVVLGMGGSALSGELLRLYLDHLGVSLPVTISRSYDIPSSVSQNSLVFAISYSGNTEETISAYRQALRKSSRCIALSSGGKLEEITSVNRNAHIKIPKGFQPRTASLTYLFFPLLRVLEEYGIIPSQEHQLDQLLNGLSKPDFNALAISISEKLIGKTPFIYTSGYYSPVGYRLKTQFNESAKIHAFSNHFSELNHNEMMGFTKDSLPAHIILFNLDDDNRRIKKRMALTRELLAKEGAETTELKMSGDHFLTKVFSSLIVGDLTAIYLALRYETDPSPVPLIESFKERLGPYI